MFCCLNTGQCIFGPIQNYSLPNDNFSDWSKLEAYADEKMNVTKIIEFLVGRVENIVGEGENTGYQHFLLFPLCSQKASFSRSLKVGIVC